MAPESHVTEELYVVAVTGGRYYRDRERVFDVLNFLHDQRRIDVLVHGGNRGGADNFARLWAEQNEVTTIREPARWNTGNRGNGEGPIRNQRLLERWKPHLLVAFPGGKGTTDMVRRAGKLIITGRGPIEVTEILR